MANALSRSGHHYCMISLKNARAAFSKLPPKLSFLEKLYICILFSFSFYTCSFLSYYIEFFKGREKKSQACIHLTEPWWSSKTDILENSTEEFYLQCSGSTILRLGKTQVMAAEALRFKWLCCLLFFRFRKRWLRKESVSVEKGESMLPTYKHSTTAKDWLVARMVTLNSNLIWTKLILNTHGLFLVQLCLLDCCLTLRNKVSEIN